MDILQSSVVDMVQYLQAHAAWAYLVLFLGSFLDALVGVGFFVYGELFFLPGAILAGTGVLDIWLVTLVLMAGGGIGDSLSFLIGARYGEKLFNRQGRLFSRKTYERGREFFHKHGVKGVFFARLLGPLSWVTPFFAGTARVPYRRFIVYNLCGVVVGIGEFIIVGYVFGRHYAAVLSFLQDYVAAIVFVVVFALIVYYTIKKRFPDALNGVRERWRHERKLVSRGLFKYATYYMVLFVLLYVGFLYVVLYIDVDFDERAQAQTPIAPFGTLSDIRNDTAFIAYSEPSDRHAVQPVNVVVVTSGSLKTLFESKGWVEDVIFSRQQLTPSALIRLWEQHTPPVSDLYVNGWPQNSAFQNQTGSSFRRLHIRFWKIGWLKHTDATVYVGSVSYDQGIDIAPYGHFFVPLHAVAPDTDKARDQIRTLFSGDPALRSATYEPWGEPRAKSWDDEEYYTDGRVLVLRLVDRTGDQRARPRQRT